MREKGPPDLQGPSGSKWHPAVVQMVGAGDQVLRVEEEGRFPGGAAHQREDTPWSWAAGPWSSFCL